MSRPEFRSRELEQGLSLQWMEEIPAASSFPLAEVFQWFFSIMIALLALMVIGGLIYGYLRIRKQKSPASKQPPSPSSSQHLLEEMEGFASRGEYLFAIKKCFQYLLQRLSEKTDLLFAATRTNGEFRQDVKRKFPAVAEKFCQLSLYYDEVWYGKKEVGKVDFQQFRQDVLRFLGEVESVERK